MATVGAEQPKATNSGYFVTAEVSVQSYAKLSEEVCHEARSEQWRLHGAKASCEPPASTDSTFITWVESIATCLANNY